MGIAVVRRSNETLPLILAPGESLVVGELDAPDGTPFTLLYGLDDALVAKLEERSQDATDTELFNNTGDNKRFAPGAYQGWVAQGRHVFALRAKDGSLAALIWFGEKQPPVDVGAGEWDTIAFRSYPPYRGQGVMGAFSRFVMEVHEELFTGHRFWLETNSDNEGGKHLYEKLGFSEAGSHEGRIVMTHE